MISQPEQLGTTLLDTLVTSITPTAHTAQLVLRLAPKSLLADKQTPDNDQAAALLTLAVLPSTAPTWCAERLSELTALVQPALASATTSVRAAAFVMIGELLEHVPAAYEQHAEEWSDKILTALKDDKEPMQLKLKACLPLIQLAAHEPAEHEEAESTDAAAKRTAIVARIVPEALTLLTAQSGAVSSETKTADKGEAKRQWQFITLLAATLEGAVQSSASTLTASLPRIVSTLLPFWVDSDAEDAEAWPARAKITAVMAAVAADEANRAIIQPHMQQLVNGLKSNAAVKDYVVRATTLDAWAAVLPAARDEVKEQMESIVDSVARVMNVEYTLSEKKKGRRGGRGEEDEEEEDEEEDEDEEGEDEDEMDDEQAEEEQDIDNERTAAFHLLQQLITHFGNEFLPHFSSAWEVILDNATEYNGEVQEQLLDTITLLPALFSPPQPAPATVSGDSCCAPAPAVTAKYQPGVTVQPPAEAVPVLQSARKLLFQLMLFSHEPLVVSHCFEALSALLQTYGQWLLVEDNKALAALMKHVKKVLKGDTICQQGFGEALPAFLRDRVEERGDDGEEEGEEGGEAEEPVVEEEDAAEEGAAEGEEDGEGVSDDNEDANNLLLEKAMDCLSTVAKVRGAAFDSQFSSLYPYILRAAAQSDTGYVYGCFADLTGPLAVAGRPSWVDTIVPKLLSVIDKQLARKSNKSKFPALRNISYASGTIIFSGQDALKDYRQQAAGKYAAIITAANDAAKALNTADKTDSSEEELSDVYGCRDNAASALGKVLLVGADQVKDQLATLIPAFLSAIPLREDSAEQSTVYSALVKLATTYTDSLKAELAPHMPVIAQALKAVVLQPVAEEGAGVCGASGALHVPRKVADFVTKAASTFYGKDGAEKDQWESEWSAEDKELFNKRISSVSA